MQETAKVKKDWKKIEERMMVENRKSDLRRARSVAVGTAGGGTTEIMMRGNDGNVLWSVMQPVEVVELIHQLAANVGCHIYLQPRKDFSSWRGWRVDENEKNLLNGHPPFPNDMALHMNVGANLPLPEHQPGLKINVEEQQNVVATEKTINQRSTKRAAKAS